MTLSKKEIRRRFQDLSTFRSKEEYLENETMMLHFRVMQLVEQAMNQQELTKKQLAEKVGTSQSYLTQLFFGNKILNFKMLAKFQDALKLHFKLDTVDKDETYDAWKQKKTPPSENANMKTLAIDNQHHNKRTLKPNLAV